METMPFHNPEKMFLVLSRTRLERMTDKTLVDQLKVFFFFQIMSK